MGDEAMPTVTKAHNLVTSLVNDKAPFEPQAFLDQHVLPLISQLWTKIYPHISSNVISTLKKDDQLFYVALNRIMAHMNDVLSKVIDTLPENQRKLAENLVNDQTKQLNNKIIQIYKLMVGSSGPKMTSSS